MSESSGCKIALTVLIVAIVMGGLGFATGFLTHAVMWTDEVAVQAPEEGPMAVEATPQPIELEPTAAVTVELPEPEVPELEVPAEPAPTIPIPADTGTSFDLFWEAWELIQRDYYGSLPAEEEMTYGAIRGAVDTLGDPFTAFIEPRAAEINREDSSGSFEGIGAYVTMDEGRLTIVSTFKGQPAETAGLRRGDIVLEVDDVAIENMSIYEAIGLIRGPAGTTVQMLVIREGEEPFEVEIERASIDVPVVEYEMREDGIAYVALFEFSSDASEKLGNAVEEMLDENPMGLVLDLRGNPGGWLNEAVLTTGLFVPPDTLALIERFKDGTERPYTTSNSPVTTDVPMVVLVDGGSASASEIVAGALQDQGRAVVIGDQTFGKGSVQWPHELSNGAELRVTVARWFTPDDRAIHGEGLAPDIVVEMTPEDVEAELDPQLDRAVEYLLEGQ